MYRIILLFLVCGQLSFSQGYTEYVTGNTIDAVISPDAGICLMGGATESDEAMVWFLNKANGGDVVVLRASGSDGYNNYFYSELGVTVNSVRTFVIDNAEGATSAYVLDKVEKAEAIWFAGGDQFDYVTYFKDNALEDALNDFINVKGGVIGGTSAGMAILGGGYFSAENGTITNAQALSNPYHNRLTLGYNDFLEIPYLENLITDSHYDDPDRRARHSTFLARYATDNSSRAFGIACNEYTAVCVDSNGRAYVFGDYPNYEEHAFFIQTNCATDYLPENCTSGNPLNWTRSNEALKVYKVPGKTTGENYFDLSDWQTGSGGEWQNWYINNGTFQSSTAVNPNCSDLLDIAENEIELINVYPNPFTDIITIESNTINTYKMFDVTGKQIIITSNYNTINTSALEAGIYFLNIENNNTSNTFKLIKN
ncbi:T9SS type A sorting domain-containing protein [Winogradskyella sp. UBA3174]|uniref:T9SS type A sorting domain-containing protein n=1 Tax=Winogradskyella sp. UBA3174 TaxID=1947785 RepID=UPI0025E8A903|nr:T9SS type A sorting domain-containing protein [Winogradskyella sp. UBA3174]|tara:strand:+ start:807 stop:2084 length:1278 start_codon:yes stop_codon:yes gene_type:complete